jgi:hypothetical protein
MFIGDDAQQGCAVTDMLDRPGDAEAAGVDAFRVLGLRYDPDLTDADVRRAATHLTPQCRYSPPPGDGRVGEVGQVAGAQGVGAVPRRGLDRVALPDMPDGSEAVLRQQA